MKTESLESSSVKGKRAARHAAPILRQEKRVNAVIDSKRSETELKGLLKEVIDLKSALDEHAIVAITNPQGRITYVNDKFCAISRRTAGAGPSHYQLGFSPGEIHPPPLDDH